MATEKAKSRKTKKKTTKAKKRPAAEKKAIRQQEIARAARAARWVLNDAINLARKNPDTQEPELGKQMSGYNYPFWAVRNGVVAALGGDSRWTLLSCLASHLPNVHPGHKRLERLTGLSESAIKSAKNELRDAGLIDFTPGGGDECTQYFLADIRRREVVAAVLDRMEARGVKEELTRSDSTAAPQPENDTLPVRDRHPTGAEAASKEHNSSTQFGAQGKKSKERPPGAADGPYGTGLSAASGGDARVSRAAAQKPGKAKLTEEAKTWFVSSPDNMDLYLRFGAGAAGKQQAECEQTLQPINTDWLQFKPQPRSEQDIMFPFDPQWQGTHMMGYYWSGVNRWRAKKGMELAFPQWNRLAGEIKKALATGTSFQVYSRIYTVINHFDLIRWRIGKLGDDLMLDEVTLNHRLVAQQSAMLMARTGPEGHHWMSEQYSRMSNGSAATDDET